MQNPEKVEKSKHIVVSTATHAAIAAVAFQLGQLKKRRVSHDEAIAEMATYWNLKAA